MRSDIVITHLLIDLIWKIRMISIVDCVNLVEAHLSSPLYDWRGGIYCEAIGIPPLRCYQA